jgi:TPR repeat protein
MFQAVHWLNAASSQGLADAQYALGVIYSQGLCGVDLNPETSGHYFQLAAEQGDVDALFALGCYWASLRDDDYSAQAIKCFKRAADKGHEPAQMALTALVDQSQPHGRSLPPVSVPRNIALSLPRASEQVAVPVEPPMLSPNSFEPGSVPPPGSSASMPITSRVRTVDGSRHSVSKL